MTALISSIIDRFPCLGEPADCRPAEKGQTCFASMQVSSLVSDEGNLSGAAKGVISQHLSAIAKVATPDDTFLLSFSGHGVR